MHSQLLFWLNGSVKNGQGMLVDYLIKTHFIGHKNGGAEAHVGEIISGYLQYIHMCKQEQKQNINANWTHARISYI